MSVENRRQFTRILFAYEATLTIEEVVYAAKIHDISLNGALISLATTEQVIDSQNGILHIDLANEQDSITMEVEVKHVHNNELGLHCIHIDIDSIGHLKRLVELNLADDKQLNKELSQLSSN